MSFFTITLEIHPRSLANFYGQYAVRHEFEIHLTRQRAIRQFVTAKNQLMSVCIASVLLLTMNFVISNIVKVVCGYTRLTPRRPTATMTM